MKYTTEKNAQDGYKSISLEDVSEIDTIEEMVITQPLNCMSPQRLMQFFGILRTKMPKGGVLKVSFVDIYKVCHMGHMRIYDAQTLHNNLLGKNNEFLCVLDLELVKAAMVKSSFKCDYIYDDKQSCTVYIEASANE